MMKLPKTPLLLAGLAAAAGLAYYLHRKSAASAASLAGITGGTVGGDTASTVAGWALPGAIGVNPPQVYVNPPADVGVTTPASVQTKPMSMADGPAASTAFVTGGGAGTDHGPVYDPTTGGQISFGSSSTLTGKALLMHNYGWSESQYESWASNPINASQVPQS